MTAVIETLGESEGAVVDFIRYLWIADNGHVREKNLYDEIKKRIKNKTTAISLSVELESRSADYAALLTSSHEKWAKYDESVRRDIDTLAFLGIKQIRPLLLSAIRKFNQKELVKLIRACINWSVRWNLAGGTPGVIERPLGQSAMKVARGEIADVTSLVADLEKIIPDDKRLHSAVSETNVKQARLARFYLRTLQRFADGEASLYVPKDDATVTLEHILPDDTTKNWAHIPTEIAKTLHNRLGNLALLEGTINSELGDASFDLKKPTFAASPFSLTRECADAEIWDAEAIAKRQRHLADLAVEAWPNLPK